MALRCTASASKRPEEVRKPQQGLAARFKLCGRKPLRGLPPSPRWTWRCALREANVRKGLGGYTRSSGTYLGPSGCANAPRGFVLAMFWFSGWSRFARFWFKSQRLHQRPQRPLRVPPLLV